MFRGIVGLRRPARKEGRSVTQLVNVNPTSIHAIYLRLIVSNGAGV
jgi:hypothetical protein